MASVVVSYFHNCINFELCVEKKRVVGKPTVAMSDGGEWTMLGNWLGWGSGWAGFGGVMLS